MPITLCMLSPLSGLRHVGFQGVSNYVALCRASYPSMVWIAQLGAPGDEEKKIGGCYFERTFTRVTFGAKIQWCLTNVVVSRVWRERQWCFIG